MDVHRLGDVLDRQLPEIVEGQAGRVLNQFEDASGNKNLSRLRQALQAGSDVDAVADQIVPLHQHVAKVDSHAESQARCLRCVFCNCINALLDTGGAAHGLDRARELGQDAVAGGAENAAVMLPHQPVEGVPAGAQGAVGALLVRPHHAGISGRIRAQDGRQLACGFLFPHRTPASRPLIFVIAHEPLSIRQAGPNP
jgi:hypothetical protein